MSRPPSPLLPASPLPEASIERLLHTACVKAGAGAALQVGLERLPLLRPFVPGTLRDAGTRESAEDIQRRLIQAIYRRYGLKPANWEVEGVLAVAQAQSVLTPLATREGLRALLRGWLPDGVSRPLMRYTPLAPLVTATVGAIAVTWAAGRYADSVCRLRKAGADWLPAPLAGALNMAPATLKAWSAEALSLAMPPLKLAAAVGRQLTGVGARAAAMMRAPLVAPLAAKPTTRKAAKKKPAKKPAAKKAVARRTTTVGRKRDP